MRALAALALVAMGLTSGSPALAADSPLCGAGGTSGSSTLQTTDGATHKYFFRIPDTEPAGTGRPVLIWMHGDGGTGAPPLGSKFYPSTDADGAIVITPNGKNKTWTHAAGDLPGAPQDSQFISLILDELDGCASVDHDTYFVGGASRGAYMPYYLLQRSTTRDRIAGAAINAGLMYCQVGDADCAEESSATVHASSARIIHFHGKNDTLVGPAPRARFHDPIDWSQDWRVFWPMSYWAHQNGCFDGGNPPADNGVLKKTFTANGQTARLYDLTGHGAACAKYQLVLVTNGGHVIGGQERRIWKFLMNR